MVNSINDGTFGRFNIAKPRSRKADLRKTGNKPFTPPHPPTEIELNPLYIPDMVKEEKRPGPKSEPKSDYVGERFRRSSKYDEKSLERFFGTPIHQRVEPKARQEISRNEIFQAVYDYENCIYDDWNQTAQNFTTDLRDEIENRLPKLYEYAAAYESDNREVKVEEENKPVKVARRLQAASHRCIEQPYIESGFAIIRDKNPTDEHTRERRRNIASAMAEGVREGIIKTESTLNQYVNKEDVDWEFITDFLTKFSPRKNIIVLNKDTQQNFTESEKAKGFTSYENLRLILDELEPKIQKLIEEEANKNLPANSVRPTELKNLKATFKALCELEAAYLKDLASDQTRLIVGDRFRKLGKELSKGKK